MLRTMKFLAKQLRHRGSAAVCPICGSSIAGFRSAGLDDPRFDATGVIGIGAREADECPVCWGRDRTRAMQFYLETKIFPSKQSVSVLHMAPEAALASWIKRQRGTEYTAADIDPVRYKAVGDVQQADITSLGFDDKQFDVIICAHVLEHIPDDRKAMGELVRVLRPGGTALLQVPYADDGRPTDEDPAILDPEERIARFGQDDHVRLYALDDYVQRLKEAGFIVSLMDPCADNPEEGARRFLNPDEKLIIATK